MNTHVVSGDSVAAWLTTTLFLLTIPLLAIWPLGIASSPFDEKRLLEVTLLLVVALLFAAVPSLRRAWRSQIATLPLPYKWWLAAILLLGVLSAWAAQLPAVALIEPALWLVLFAVLTAIAALRSRLGDHFDQAMIAMLAFILLVYLLVVSGYVVQALAGARDLDFRKLFVNFNHLRFFNQFQSWTLPLAVVPLLYAAQRGWGVLKWLLFAAAANWWALLFISGGRGALVAVAAATLLVVLLFKRRLAAWLKWQSAAALSGLLFFLLVTQLLPALVARVYENPPLSRTSLSGREDLWMRALSMIADHPLLGVGPLHYSCTEPALAAHPHNALLQISAEWGLPAALLIVALLLLLFYRAIVLTRRSPVTPTAHDLAPPLLVALFAAALHAQFSGIIIMPISQVMLVVVGGWVWGVLSPARTEAPPSRWPYRAWLLLGGAAGALLLQMIAPVWRDAIDGTFPILEQERVHMPRIWIDGEICRDRSVAEVTP